MLGICSRRGRKRLDPTEFILPIPNNKSRPVAGSVRTNQSGKRYTRLAKTLTHTSIRPAGDRSIPHKRTEKRLHESRLHGDGVPSPGDYYCKSCQAKADGHPIAFRFLSLRSTVATPPRSQLLCTLPRLHLAKPIIHSLNVTLCPSTPHPLSDYVVLPGSMFASDAHTANGIMWRSPRLLLPVIVVFSLLSLWYTRSHTQFSVGRLGFHKASAVAASVPASDHFPDIRNATLGVRLPGPWPPSLNC